MKKTQFKTNRLIKLHSLLFSLLFIVFTSIGGCGGGNGDEEDQISPPMTSQNRINVEIIDAEIRPDRRAVVTLRLLDNRGNSINREEVSMNFLIARIENGEDEYFSYLTRVQSSPITGADSVQATSERASGEFLDLGNGTLQYTFEFSLPEGYNRDATHTVGIYATRTIGEDTFVSNDTFNFVPSGSGGTGVRDIVSTTTCNTCHDPLQLHGGSRRDVKLCVMCHSTKIEDPDTGEIVEHVDPDTGNNIGLEIMAHKIHMGEQLPSVQEGTPYEIIGFRQSVHNYSHVGFPQDIRNCNSCHAGNTAQMDNFMNNPSRDACGACHDDVDFATATNHPTVETTDNNCSGCHIPSTGNEFDISVTGAHTVPLKSRELPGVNFTIVSVKSAETGSERVSPGEHPEVTFQIRNDNGEIINPEEMDFMGLTFAGPTEDYENTPVREDPRQSAVSDGSGNFIYTFNTPVPDDARGTFTMGVEGYKFETVGGQSKVLVEEVRDAGRNEVFDFPITDFEANPRRMVADNALCSDCHGEFSKDFTVHGGIRNNVQYCILCHNATQDDIDVRPVPEGQNTAITASINFRHMIHKIHTGAELTEQPYIVYGFRGSVHNYSELRYPGDRRNCEGCHLPDTQILDPGKGILGARILPTTEREFRILEGEREVVDTFTTSPVISLCSSCHDDLGINVAGNMLTGENHLAGPQPESACADCHIANSPLGVESVHIPPLSPEERINRPE